MNKLRNLSHICKANILALIANANQWHVLTQLIVAILERMELRVGKVKT